MRGRGGGVCRPVQAETAADAFLNWVRQPVATGDGLQWRTFMDNNIGMFLRNAVIRNYPGGMVGFYQAQGVIPMSPIDDGIPVVTDPETSVRLMPVVAPSTRIGFTSYLPSSVPIYGWLDVQGQLDDGSEYWLLIADQSNRLVWVAENGVGGYDTSLLTTQNQTDPAPLDPARTYTASDLNTILGV